MAAIPINDFLARESGRYLENQILQKTLRVSPWLQLTPEGTWSPEMGAALKVLMLGRALPAAGNTYVDGGDIGNPAYDPTYWTDVGGEFGSGTANDCQPPLMTIQTGSDSVSFNLQHLALNSQDFCATNLMQSFAGKRQLAGIVRALAQITGWVMAEKFRRDFTYWCADKIVVNQTAIFRHTNAGGVAGAADFNFGAGPLQDLQTSGADNPGQLRNEMLDELYEDLDRRGAQEFALFNMDDGPIFSLITNGQTAQGLRRAPETRQDIRWSKEVEDLLKGMNARTAPRNGFQYSIDSFPPRWKHVGGSGWVKIEPYIIRAGTDKGFTIQDNPKYKSVAQGGEATYQDSFVHTQGVIEEVYPDSIGNSSGTGFTPVNYRGVWGWRNIIQPTLNEDGDIGHFRGRFMLGAMPKYTDYGCVIRHAVCASAPTYGPCPIDS